MLNSDLISAICVIIRTVFTENSKRLNKMKKMILPLLLLLAINSCGKDDGKSSDPNVTIANNNFEKDGGSQTPSGWTTTSSSDQDADYSVSGGYSGSFSLEHKKSAAYKVLTSQKLTGLDTGYYSVSVWVKNSGGQNSCYITAKEFGGEAMMTSLPVTSEWKKVMIRGIHVTNRECTIGFYSDALANNWCRFDDVSMLRDGIKFNFLKGGDISELSYIESMGGKFYENGTQKDGLQILKDNGFNIVRLRLYNDPGNPAFTPSNRLPAGFQDQADILRQAKRAKNLGLKILLTFYYSDYWSNEKTHLWKNTTYPVLLDSVYNFTFKFMTRMKQQGTEPEFVSLGNEISGGIVMPDGASSNFARMCEYLNQGSNAVKAVSPAAKVIIHIDDGGNKDKYDWFFGNCKTYGVKYDIIGASYYPFWTQRTVTQIVDWAEYISAKFDKDILIMETGYNWNPTLPDGKGGQLGNNGPYQLIYPSSPEGQRDFLYEVFSGIKNVKDGRLIGDIYWDPVMIEVPGVGWELGADNVVSNTTLFDFSGNALPSLKVFKFNN
jgi:arabinogalactan endo-1,4-beta-galactosidase